jgi:hypothetical protein
MTVKRYNKIAAELVVSPRDVLEVHSSRPPSMTNEHEQESSDAQDDADRWENTPCTD